MKRDDKTFSLRSRSGFSLVELLVYMAILGVLMAMVLMSFTKTLQQSAQQSDIAETQIATGVGLGLLRSDLERAGFGLPWACDSAELNYVEPAPLGNAPHALGCIRALDSADAFADAFPLHINNGADYLVIRATNVIQPNDRSGQKLGLLGNDNNSAPQIWQLTNNPLLRNDNTSNRQIWQLANLNNLLTDLDDFLRGNDWVIALHPGGGLSSRDHRELVMDAGGRFAFPATVVDLAPITPDPSVIDPNGEKLLLYGIINRASSATPPRRPFNRTDYYISGPNDPNIQVPRHCADRTGVLMKSILRQDNDQFTVQPVIDCVADFQVVYILNGIPPANASQLAGLNPEEIRSQVREIRCYILLHEGREDRSYTHPNQNIAVGPTNAAGNLLAGRNFNLATIGPDWRSYRWKVVNVTVSPSFR